MAMPHVTDDDLYLYMHEIIEEEFPKALRQAFKTLWDQKYALIDGPFDSACHRVACFHALDSNTFRWLFPNQVSSMFQRPSNPVSSTSFGDLDLLKLRNIVLNDLLPQPSPYLSFQSPWDFSSSNPEIPNVDNRLFATAIDQLRAIEAEHVYTNGIMDPQILKRQLAQARGVFAAFNVTLNDSRNTFDFSAVGLQELISGSGLGIAALPFPSGFGSGLGIAALPFPSGFGSGFGIAELPFPRFEWGDCSIWIKGKRLGGGSFGEVFRLTHRESGIKVAMKAVKMTPQGSELPEGVKQLENELVKLRRLRHPRIVRVHGSERRGDFIYLFLDFMAGGSLRDFIKQSGKLDERLTRKFTRQILEGVDYLHDNEVTHRDIKGPNILLDSDRSVKLADFGVSKKIEKIGTKTDLKSFVGSTYWMAPEILRGEGYGRKVDIWSVGCTVVEMLTGDPPLKHLEPHAAMYHIGEKLREIVVELPGSTEEARDFVRAALIRNPTERPNCKELLTHPFVKELDEELLLRAATQAEDSNNQERKKQKGKRKGSRQVSSLAYAQHPGVQTGKRQRKKR